MLAKRGRHGCLHVPEAKAVAFTMLPCHCRMCGVRSSANNFCFSLFHKRGSRMYLGPGDIWDRSVWNVHSQSCAAMLHSRSSDCKERPWSSEDTSYPEWYG